MSDKLHDHRILFMAADGVELSELDSPLRAVLGEKADADLATPDGKPIQGFDGVEPGRTVRGDLSIADVDTDKYDTLVLPGGVGNPDRLRQDKRAVEIVREFATAGKPIAAICHAPWLLVEAGIVDGRTLTSYPSLRTDIENAGGDWVDEEVVVDAGLVTSRTPHDLEAFEDKLVEEACEGRHQEQADQARRALAGSHR